MIKDKKIKLQAKIIHDLQEENESLLKRIRELEKIVSDNENIISAVETYRKEYAKCMESLDKARDRYLQAVKDMNKQNIEYKREINELIKTIRKNI